MRPELVSRPGSPRGARRATATRRRCCREPTRVARQVGALGAAPARLSLAFLAGAALDAELPDDARARARSRAAAACGAADMVRNDRRGTVRVDPRTAAVTLDGEPVAAEPVGAPGLRPAPPAGLTGARTSVPGMATRPAPYTSPLAEELADDLLERFLRYDACRHAVRARPRRAARARPGQLELGRMLVDELRAVGLTDAELDDNGYVMATLPATIAGRAGRSGWSRTSTRARTHPARASSRSCTAHYDGGVVELPARRHGARPRRDARAGRARPATTS